MTHKLRNMRKYMLALFIMLLASAGTKVFASHYAAADIYLDYIGSGPGNFKYKVTLIIYKACEPGSIDLSDNEVVHFGSSCYGTIDRILNQPNNDTLDQLCPNFAPINSCRVSGSQWPAFVRKTFTDTITLPMACSDTKVWWTSGSRNGGILNLATPSGQNIYVDAGVDNVLRYNNSSPRFIIDPIPYLCVNQPQQFLNGPFDINNDSMQTTNLQPRGSGPTNFLNYTGTYSLTNPIASTSTPPYTVNANTGTALFTPSLSGKFVIAFKCEEYDRLTGAYVGFTTRDVQVAVLNCAASAPNIDTPQNIVGASWIPTPPNGGYLLACPGAPFSFTLGAQSTSTSNFIYLEANNILTAPGSQYNVIGNGTANPIGTFSWTPNSGDIGDHTIIFTAKDSTCGSIQPIVLKNYYVLFVKVLPGVDGGPDGRICAYEGQPWQFNASGPPGATFQWSGLTPGSTPVGLSNPNIANPTAYPPYNFTYVVYSPQVNSVCRNKDTMTVYIDTSNWVEAVPHNAVVCRPGYFQLNATPFGSPPRENLPCGIAPNPQPCTEDTAEVRTQFSGGNVQISSTFTPFPGNHRSSRVQMLLTKSDMYAYGMRSGTIKSLSFDVTGPSTTPFKNFTIALKCTDRKDLSALTGGFESGATLVYTAPAAGYVTSLGWNTITLDNPYDWDSTKSLVIEICYSNTATGLPAAVNTVLGNSYQYVINYTNTGTGNVCQNPLAGQATVYNTQRPIVKINFCKSQTLPFSYTWSLGKFLSDSTTQNPLAYVPKSITYQVSTYGGNGCKIRDSIQIKVPIHSYDVFPKDSATCFGEGMEIQALGNFAAVQWYEDDGSGYYTTPTTLKCNGCVDPNTYATPIATPPVTTIYHAVMSDADGCSDTMDVRVVIKPLPVVNIINNDTIIKYGQSIQLLVSGAYLYSWSPLSSLSNPNIVNPMASPKEPTKYYVYGVAENGCRGIDSVKVNIDYRDNLFVPTAFTPNGDGKNDIFHISNITFQRLQEFRVFNRWGQEIFSTNDIRKGWDGSWKGVPQDMGAYQYIIRVAYPDGYVETYKGDVTLVR